MTTIYRVYGMTCEACEYQVKHIFGKIENVSGALANHKNNTVIIESTKELEFEKIKSHLNQFPKYQFSNFSDENIGLKIDDKGNEGTKTKLETYKPLLLIFGIITAVSAIVSLNYSSSVHNNTSSVMVFMNVFMAGFFLIFSFFKLLNLKAFASSFAMYDIVAKKWPFWGYLYPFIELGLGFLYILFAHNIMLNIFMLILMAIGTFGVAQSVLKKQKIQCACLGTVFDLPMSNVTIIENSIMITMGIFMLFLKY